MDLTSGLSEAIQRNIPINCTRQVDKVYVRCKKEKGKKKLTKRIIEVRLITKRCQDDTNHNIRIEGTGHLLMKSEN